MHTHTHTHTQFSLSLSCWCWCAAAAAAAVEGEMDSVHAHGVAHTRAGMDRASIDKGAGVGGPPSSTILPAAPAAVHRGHPSRAHRSAAAAAAAASASETDTPTRSPQSGDPRWPDGLRAHREVSMQQIELFRPCLELLG